MSDPDAAPLEQLAPLDGAGFAPEDTPDGSDELEPWLMPLVALGVLLLLVLAMCVHRARTVKNSRPQFKQFTEIREPVYQEEAFAVNQSPVSKTAISGMAYEL